MPIKRPPALVPLESLTGAEIAAYQRYSRITDEKGRYLPFDEFCCRTAKGENVALAWSMTRRARDAAIQLVNFFDHQGQQAGFVSTSLIAQACEFVDKHATTLAMNDLLKRLRGAGAELHDLQLEEPITSSQLEGANTTTLIARNMLETGRRPHTEDEHMIAGNARLMKAIPDLLDEPLTPELIRRFHAIGMENIDDAKYTSGEFRTTDDIVIMDSDGNIVHQPPAAKALTERLENICHWVNSSDEYIHPLIKACILHFMVAHEHPFRDGNGRTSRALFYWFMLKNDYGLFRYISISSLLHIAPVKYAHSYIYSETDGLDLTYFIEYQFGVIHRALDNLLRHINELLQRSASIDRMLFQSGILSSLTARQVTIFNIMLANARKDFSVVEVSEALGISNNTARNDLRKLVQQGLIKESAQNDQKTVYKVSADYIP